MNQRVPTSRPSKDRAAQPSGKRSASATRDSRKGGGAIWILLAITLFTLAYGGILLMKIQQERAAMLADAERSQANTAGYLAERVTGRIAEARYALAIAAQGLDSVEIDEIEPLGTRELCALLRCQLQNRKSEVRND